MSSATHNTSSSVALTTVNHQLSNNHLPHHHRRSDEVWTFSGEFVTCPSLFGVLRATTADVSVSTVLGSRASDSGSRAHGKVGVVTMDQGDYRVTKLQWHVLRPTSCSRISLTCMILPQLRLLVRLGQRRRNGRIRMDTKPKLEDDYDYDAGGASSHLKTCGRSSRRSSPIKVSSTSSCRVTTSSWRRPCRLS